MSRRVSVLPVLQQACATAPALVSAGAALRCSGSKARS